MKRYWKYIPHIFINMKLQKKILLSYFILIIIPLIGFFFYSYDKIAKDQEKISYSASQSFDQTYSFLSYKLYRIINISDVIATDKLVNDILTKDISQYTEVDQLQDMYDLSAYLSSFQDHIDISKARLYLQEGLLYSDQNMNMYNLQAAMKTQWFNKLSKWGDKVLCCPSSYLEEIDKNIISVARLIRNPRNYHKIVGVVRLDIDRKYIDDIIKKVSTTSLSLTYLQNSEGVIVTSSNQELLNSYRILGHEKITFSSEGTPFSEMKIGRDKFLYKSRLIPDTDWKMVTVIPYSSVIEEAKRQKYEIILMVLILGTVAYALAYIITYSITKRISRLIGRMRKVQNGVLDAEIANTSRDEIGELIENYNFMIQRIASLVREQYELGQELKSAELKALQSQINPHFLYNTLDMINWLSKRNSVNKVSTVTKALAQFYRLSLNKGMDITTIGNELQHVTSYVNIQNVRFLNKIHLVTDVDENIQKYPIPKITLQPIVENAVLHGILEKEDKSGTILIKAWKEEDTVVLSIEDNGVGITELRLREIISGTLSGESGSGYGIQNTNQRIKLLFGEKFGLRYKSTLGEGTTVEVRIPVLRGESLNK